MANIFTKKLNFSKLNTNSIKLSSNLIRFIQQDNQETSSSPRLLNWVEPTTIAGYEKSTFYTEVDSNLKKGERVFLVNGSYDSDALIDIDKYKKGRDGYKILDIDKCKVTLDIDYTGTLPWIEDDIDNFIKVHQVRNQREFDYINKQFVSRLSNTDSLSGMFNKFEIGQNNIIYVGASFSGISYTFGQNNGVSSPGFYVKLNSTTWYPITTDLLTNSSIFSTYLSTSFPNNVRIKIINGTFIDINGREWRDSAVYTFENNEWIVDATYMRPFLTKSNFRDGNFKGKWNKGVYGSYDKKIKWKGIDSTWYNGSTLNTEWLLGAVNSNSVSKTSYFAEIDQFGLPVQKVNIANNRGFGYNYFIDMDISSSVISNGNYINCNIGVTGSTFSVVDRYYQKWNNTLPNTINAGEFTSCNIDNSIVKDSVLKGSRTVNTHIESSKSINSNFNDSVFYKSNYESDELIKISSYDEWNLSLGTTYSSDNYKMYKFYINEYDILRLRSLDKFYIKGLRLTIDDNYTLESDGLINFFDRAFIMDSYQDSDDAITSLDAKKIQRDIICKISTSSDNTYRLNSFYNGTYFYTATSSVNEITLPSIDVIVKIDSTNFGSGDYNYTFGTPSLSPTYSLIAKNVDVTNAYIIDSYFDSGLFEQSNWNSGRYYGYNLDNNLFGSFTQSNLLISTISSNQLLVQIPAGSLKGVKDDYFNINDIVYLNSIDYNDGVTVTRLPNTYKISNKPIGIIPGYTGLVLDEYLIGSSFSIISSLTGSGVFLTSPDGLTSSISGTNRYNYLHKFRVNKSIIKNGLFRRSFISNSTIQSDIFNNSDYSFNDKVKLKDLIFLDLIMSDNSNTIKSGLFGNSYFRNGTDTWNNGILWKSIWENGTFNNGVVRESNWINGSFNNGMFYNSKSSFFVNGVSSYYKSGLVSILISNNRNVWENGIFYNGDFFDSIWENGKFKKGKMYKSSWADGIFEDGLFGDIKFNTSDNNFYGGTFSNGVVVNSDFYSGWTYSQSNSFGGIHWINGIFQSGIFRNDVINPNAKATWYNGTFNGGDFTNTALWLNGTFNDGKFTSYYGITYSISNSQSQYGWQNGILNGGEFGNANGTTNSTWWYGEMNGGTFKGKVWNNGIFSSGKFIGSGTLSCVGGMSSSNASSFVDGFTNSYYGLWRDGLLTNVKDKFIKHKELFTTIGRSSEELRFSEKVNMSKAVMENALWMTGTFSHQNGTTNNVVWLDGTFEIGTFKSSSFNPYVKRNGSTTQSFNLNDTCVWKDGNFDGGDFFISKWEKGHFIIGTAHGMIWQNGTSNYMNAFNVCWEDGLWRNGNWYGSPYSFNGYINDDYTKQILFRLMNDCNGTSSCHIWNIFEDTSSSGLLIVSATASTPIVPPIDLIPID